MVDAAVEQAMLKYVPPATLPAGEQTTGFVSAEDFAQSDPAKADYETKEAGSVEVIKPAE